MKIQKRPAANTAMQFLSSAVYWTVVLLTATALASRNKRYVDFNFTDSVCSTAEYMLKHSIPASCNDYLSALVAPGLPLEPILQVETLGDLCTAYCSMPLRQAGEDCPELAQLHSTISIACCRNENGNRCFDVQGFLEPVISNCSHLSDSNCTSQCYDTLQTAKLNMGCCFHELYTQNSSTSFANSTNQTQPSYWQSEELLDSCGLLTEEEEGEIGWGCGCGKASRVMSYTALVAASVVVTLLYSLYLQL